MVFCSRMHGHGTVQLCGSVQAWGPSLCLVSPSEEGGGWNSYHLRVTVNWRRFAQSELQASELSEGAAAAHRSWACGRDHALL